MHNVKLLSSLLRLDHRMIQRALNHIESQYKNNMIDKKRIISQPSANLKLIQRKIKNWVSERIDFPKEFHSVAGKSSLTNAEIHVKSKYYLKVDIKQYFPSIKPQMVYTALLKQLDIPSGLAQVLTKLTTYNHQLPQGAPTSVIIANLVALNSWFDPISKLVKQHQGKLSLYVDDLTISSKTNQILNILPQIKDILRKEGFKINNRKTLVSTNPSEIVITGYKTDGKVYVGKQMRNEVRQDIFKLKKMINNFPEFQIQVSKVTGKISYLKRTNLKHALKLEAQLNSIISKTTGISN